MHARHLLAPWFYLFIAGAVALEVAWYLLVRKRAYPWQEMVASLALYGLRLLTKLVRPLALVPIMLFVWSHRFFTIPLDTAWGLALLFLGEELAYYWMHRAGHEIRWMWASHLVHHTPEHIHLASAFRLSPSGPLSGEWLFYLPLYLLGLHPLAVHSMLFINLAYQFLLHTDVVGRLGPLEWLFNTPSHHRVHHASNPGYLDRNYGGIVIVWDRLFGTFAQESPQTRLIYGLARPVGSLNPIRIICHEWRAIARDIASARSWRERLKQVFGRPGESLTAMTPSAVAAE
jgi:sterol desaturase/sphingolipid hydroxylase (fatty acid hydroxylase superfamily)